jgi:hypothetical protein
MVLLYYLFFQRKIPRCEIQDPASVMEAQYFINNDQIIPEIFLDSRGETVILKVLSHLEKGIEYILEIEM